VLDCRFLRTSARGYHWSGATLASRCRGTGQRHCRRSTAPVWWHRSPPLWQQAHAPRPGRWRLLRQRPSPPEQCGERSCSEAPSSLWRRHTGSALAIVS
jgi:hypothetical protein